MRIHLGASRSQLAAPNVASLRTEDWVHLGEPESFDLLRSSQIANQPSIQGSWLSFYYKRDDVLPFPDDHFSFGYSEHFFEHLFLDEACELFKECYRVLRPGACLRTAVPDADLRTYMELEPAGFTVGDQRWYHPDKHKTRWSIYSLTYVLEQIGFHTRGVVYCDKFGRHYVHPPDPFESFYQNCLDQPIVLSREYICRFEDSLIVDALKGIP